MTVFYLDTSAIVKRYRTEKGTEFIDRLFKEIETSEHRLATSFLSVLEFVSALRRLVKAKEISQEIFADSLARFVADIERYFAMSPVDDTTISKSIFLIIKHAVKTADSIHLVSAIELREVLRKSEERLIFVGDDEELCTAALNESIDVINPRENGAMQKLGEYLK